MSFGWWFDTPGSELNLSPPPGKGRRKPPKGGWTGPPGWGPGGKKNATLGAYDWEGQTLTLSAVSHNVAIPSGTEEIWIDGQATFGATAGFLSISLTGTTFTMIRQQNDTSRNGIVTVGFSTGSISEATTTTNAKNIHSRILLPTGLPIRVLRSYQGQNSNPYYNHMGRATAVTTPANIIIAHSGGGTLGGSLRILFKKRRATVYYAWSENTVALSGATKTDAMPANTEEVFIFSTNANTSVSTGLYADVRTGGAAYTFDLAIFEEDTISVASYNAVNFLGSPASALARGMVGQFVFPPSLRPIAGPNFQLEDTGDDWWNSMGEATTAGAPNTLQFVAQAGTLSGTAYALYKARV